MKNKIFLLSFFSLFFFFISFLHSPMFAQGSGNMVVFNGTDTYLQSGEDGNLLASSENVRMEGWFKFDNVTKAVFLIDIANNNGTVAAAAFPAPSDKPDFRTQKALWWSGSTGALNIPANRFVVTFRDNVPNPGISPGFNNANGCSLPVPMRGFFYDFSFPFTPLPNVWYHLSAVMSSATPAAGSVQVEMFVNGIALDLGGILQTTPSGTGGVCPTMPVAFANTGTATAPVAAAGSVISNGSYGNLGGDVETNVFIGMRPDELSAANVYPAGGIFLFQGQADQIRITNDNRTQAGVRKDMCTNKNTNPPNTGANWINYTFDDTYNAGGGDFFDDSGTNAFVVPARIFGTQNIIRSNAPIGDESAFTYGTTNVSISYPTGTGTFGVTATSAPTVMHVYRVDASPNNVILPTEMGNFDTRYFGLFTGTNNINYTATFTFGTNTNPAPPLPGTPTAVASARRLRNDAGAFAYDNINATATTHTITGLTTNLAATTPINQQEFIYGGKITPVLANIEAGVIAYLEGAGNPATNPTAPVTTAITVTSGANITRATVQITANLQAGTDVLDVTLLGGFAKVYDASTGLLTITGSGTAANYQTMLQSVTYRSNSDNPTNFLATRTPVTATFTAFVGAISSNTQTRNITINPTNDAPIISGTTTPISYVKLAPAVSVASAIGIADVDDTQLTQAVVTITGFSGAQDEFKFTVPLPAGITSGDINGATGVATAGTITFSGTANITTYRALLASLTYRNTSGAPAPATRTVAFQVTDNNTNLFGGGVLANAMPNPSVVINIDATFNYPPTLDAGCPTMGRTFTEGEVSTPLLAAGLDINESIDLTTNLSKAEFKITTGYQALQDELFYDGMLPASVNTSSWNAMTGTYTLTGVDLITNYETFAQNIKYRNNNLENPTGGGRTITVQFFDNGFPDGTAANIKSTSLCSIALNVVSVNDAPILGAQTCTNNTFTEDGAAVQILTAIPISDVDNASLGTATIRIDNTQTGDVLSYIPIGGNPVTANNYTIITNVGTLTLGANGATHAQLEAALAGVRFSNTSQNPNTTVRTISFVVNDRNTIAPINLNSNIVTCQVNVVPVNDAPVLANVELANLQYTEGEVAKQISNTITVNDVDNPNLVSATITISGGFVAGEDLLEFVAIMGNPVANAGFTTGGVLTLNGTATLAQYQEALRSVTYRNTSQNPNTSVRTVSFVVNDGSVVATTNLNSNIVNRQISIIPVNNPPVLDNPSATLNYTENEGARIMSPNITIVDVDNLNLSSATIRITGNYFANQDVLGFTNAFGINGIWNAGNSTLTLTGNSSVVNYQNALRTITYTNTSENPSNLQRTVTITVNDGTDNSNAVIQTINITPVNDPPQIMPFRLRTGVNVALSISNIPFTEVYTDIENDPIQRIIITSLPTRGTLTFNGNAVTVGQIIPIASVLLVYTPEKDFEGGDVFQWRASDRATGLNPTDISGLANAYIQVSLTDLYPPEKLSAQAGNKQISLTWVGVFVEGVQVDYEVYILEPNQPWKFLARTNEEKLLVTNLENTITYTFRVLAVDNLNRTSGFSNLTSARPSIVLGAEGSLEAINFLLFPNPNAGDFILQFEEKQSKKAQIFIFNTIGQKVFDKQIKSLSGRYEEKIVTDLLAEGTYILYIQAEDKHYQKRFVVQK
jgi:hypothetical protein